jgi:hypothetical protein
MPQSTPARVRTSHLPHRGAWTRIDARHGVHPRHCPLRHYHRLGRANAWPNVYAATFLATTTLPPWCYMPAPSHEHRSDHNVFGLLGHSDLLALYIDNGIKPRVMHCGDNRYSFSGQPVLEFRERLSGSSVVGPLPGLWRSFCEVAGVAGRRLRVDRALCPCRPFVGEDQKVASKVSLASGCTRASLR